MPEHLLTIEDELALRAVSARYAAGVDRRDTELFLSALHPDARLRAFQPGQTPGKSEPGFDATGHAGLAPVVAGMAAYARTFHLLGNALYEMRGQNATGEVYCLAHHLSADPDNRTDQVMAIRYHDTYQRDHEEWRISERTIVVDWSETRPADLPAPRT